jgi:hypothetical protein
MTHFRNLKIWGRDAEEHGALPAGDGVDEEPAYAARSRQKYEPQSGRLLPMTIRSMVQLGSLR